jgi:hypothetical protein
VSNYDLDIFKNSLGSTVSDLQAANT